MTTGDNAEGLAADYLRERGLRLLERNYRCRFGEIDLIMQERDVLVFVEVRLRRHDAFGGALASIDRRKQQRLLAAARHYLQGRRDMPPCRFDALLLTSLDTREAVWLRDAFGE